MSNKCAASPICMPAMPAIWAAFRANVNDHSPPHMVSRFGAASFGFDPMDMDTPAIERLVEFNTPENFAASWLELIARDLGKAGALMVRSWEWVVGQSRSQASVNERS